MPGRSKIYEERTKRVEVVPAVGNVANGPGQRRVATRDTWNLAPRTWSTPGTVVSVVNSYAATSECVPVSLVMSVDLPTEGKPADGARRRRARGLGLALAGAHGRAFGSVLRTDEADTGHTGLGDVEACHTRSQTALIGTGSATR